MNVIRSGNSGIDRIALDDRWEGEWFPRFPLVQPHRRASIEGHDRGWVEISLEFGDRLLGGADLVISFRQVPDSRPT